MMEISEESQHNAAHGSPFEHFVRSRRQVRSRPVSAFSHEPVGLERGGDSKAARASGPGGPDSRNGILDHQAGAWLQTKPAGSFEKDVRGRFLEDDILADHHRVEGFGWKTKRTEVALDLHAISARGYGQSQAPGTAAADEFRHTGKRFEPALDQLEVDFISPDLVAWHLQDHAPCLRDPTQEPILAHANERAKVFAPDGDTFLRKHPHGRLGNE